MRGFRVAALVCAALSISSCSQADAGCRWWLLECIGKKSTEDVVRAAQTIGDSAVKSSDIAFSAINYWPWLISKYHTGTAEEKANARTIIKQVFGSDSLEGAQPFEISFSFEGVDSDKQKLDFILLRDYAAPNVDGKILVGNTIDFQAHAVTGKSWPVKESYASYAGDVGTIRDRVRRNLDAARMASESPFRFAAAKWPTQPDMNAPPPQLPLCYSLLPGARGKVASSNLPEVDCSTLQDWQRAYDAQEKLVDAIMAVVDSKVDKLGSRPTVKFSYEGYKYLTMVFPEDQLRQNPQMKVSFSIHVKGKPEQPIPVMSSGPWSRTQGEILKGGSLHPTRLSNTMYRAFIIDLGVAGPPHPSATRGN